MILIISHSDGNKNISQLLTCFPFVCVGVSLSLSFFPLSLKYAKDLKPFCCLNFSNLGHPYLDGLIFGDLTNFFALKKRCKACEEMHPKQVIKCT
jgi:hypothetical protein